MKNNHELMKGVNRIFLLLLLSAVCCYTSFAQPPCDTPFYIDGNPTEWDDPEVTGLPFFSYVLDPYGQGVVDNAFTQGTKDFLIASKKIWEIGQTKPKNDLCNGAAVVRVDCNGDYLLHFAGDRSKIQGDAMIGFWLLLNGTGPVIGTAPNGQPLYNFAPEHAYGDLLILSNFQNGGRLATVLIYMWVGPGNGNYGNNNSLILTSFTGTAAQNNDAMYDIPMGWSYPGAQYPLNAFYEGVINLNEIYEQGPAGALPDLCKATWLLEARSSTELTAALDDFIGGPFGIEPLPPSASLSECYPGYYCLEVTPSEPGVIRWYPTEADALAGTNMIQEGVSYCTNFTQTTTLYITLTNVVECTSAPGMAVMTITGGPEVTDSHTNVLCYGGSDGTVTLTFSGGASPYMVNFNGGGFVAKTSPAVYSNLAAGTYSWVVKDANNCTADGSEVVTQPTQVTATDNHTNVLCYGGNDGSVTITFSGGTPPYMVNFNGGGFVAKTSPAVYSNLAAGTYSWVVKDANNCTADGSEVVTQPTQVTATDNHTNVLCYGGNDGSVTITFSGGTPPYMVNFNGGGFVAKTSPAVYSNLAAGTYSWVVKDANNCTADGSEVVTQPTQVTATDNHTNVLCYGGNDGSVTITFSGGTPPYMVNFNGGGFVAKTSPAVYSNLAAGTYSWVVKDANNCTADGSEVVTQPTQVTATDNHTNVLCYGGNDGSVTITFSGGTPPYMVNFNGGGFVAKTSPAVYSNLAAGTYSWVVKDANNCTADGSEVVTQPTQVTATDNHTNVLCYGGNDGSVTITFSGGTPPYMVNFNGGGFVAKTSPAVYSNLAAGTYSWVVKDANNCTADGSEVVTQPTQVTATDNHTNVLCYGGNDGSVTITFSGGTPPYMVNFNGGGFVAKTSPAVYSNLAAGTYSWVVKDANNCTADGSEVVTQPTQVTATDNHTNVLCYGGNDGSVTITFSGGTPPYMVNFNGGGFVAKTSPAVYSNLAAGTYSWVVKDANNCTADGSEVVTQPTQVTATDNHTNVLCYGGNDGSVTITFSGGTPPYMVNFNGGGFVAKTSPAVYSNLTAGTYSWVVKDANNCTADGSEVVTQPTQVTATDNHTNVLCYGGNDGSVTITFSGGTPPYMVNFNGGGFVAKTSPAVYSNLTAGTYSWVVKDANNCTADGSEVVTQPTQVTATDNHTNVLCYGGNDGSVTITFSGGTPPYMVNFNGGGFVAKTSPAVYSNLTAGTYSWVVKDANNCTADGSEVVTQPTQVTATDNHTNVLCYGGNDGSVTITFSGGTPPYMVNFNGGGFVAKTSPAVYSNLTAGTYSWVVKDANNCTADGSEVVGQPPLLEVSLIPLDAQCALDVQVYIPVTITGGTAPYQVKLDDGDWEAIVGNETLLATYPGSHTVYVKDANNCTAQDDLTIDVDEILCETEKLLDANCEGSGGSAIVYGYGGVEPYEFLWDNGETTQTAVNLSPGVHLVTIWDARLCETQCEVTIGQLPCEELCTYTQGKYGNQGNSSICDGEMSYPTAEFVEMLLGEGELALGWGANLLIFQSGDAGLIDAILPSQGSNELITGTCYVNTPCISSYLTKQGRLKSGLIGQTLTLGLNLRINDGLSTFELQSEGLLTTQEVEECGSGIPVEMVCEPIYDDLGMIIGYDMVVNPYWYDQVNPGLLCYMAENGYDLTVGGLYLLANHALGGFATFPASVTCGDITYEITLTTIKDAVDMINNIFDECRIFVGYLDEMILCPPVFYSAPAVNETAQPVSSNVEVSVMPNPFSVSTEITVTTPIDTRADVEVYDMTGRRITSLFSGNLLAGSINTFRFTTDSRGAQQSFMLVVRSQQGVVVKRIIDMK